MQSCLFHTKGELQTHWLVLSSQCLGAGHSTQLGPYLPAGQVQLAPFHSVVGGGQKHVLFWKFHCLGAGHGTQ